MGAILADLVTRRRLCRRAAAPGMAMMLGACSTLPMSGMDMQGSDTLAAQPGDRCASERAAFGHSQSYFAKDIISETMLSGIEAVAIGALRRLATGQSTHGIGGQIGADALSGAQSGYLSAMTKRHQNPRDMLQQMNSDLARESSEIDALNEKFENLQACRFRQAQLIKARADHGELSPVEARAQLAEERRLFAEELARARQSGSNMRSRDEQFEYAARSLQADPAATAVAPQETSRAVATATVTLPRKRDTFVAAVSDAEVRSKGTLSDDVAGA